MKTITVAKEAQAFIDRVKAAKKAGEPSRGSQIIIDIMKSKLPMIVKYYLVKAFKESDRVFFNKIFGPKHKNIRVRKAIIKLLTEIYDYENEDGTTSDLFYKGVGQMDEYIELMKV